MKSISGHRFGRLTAISIHHSTNHRRFWECQCDCGKLVLVRQDQLTTGKTKSCGCYQQESQQVNLKKGWQRKIDPNYAVKIDGHRSNWNPIKHEHPRLYRIWQSMKSRCYYPRNKCFHCYGGRGISICDEWLQSFNSFAHWALENGYNDELSIDRINVDGNYAPKNCRWITMVEQQRNKRKTSHRLGER